MKFLRHLSPLRAVRDLRGYLAQRRPHEIGFFGLAIAVTYLIVVGMMYESRHAPPPYHRDIVYVQQWPANRSDAEIVAQQKIDGVAQTKRENELKRLEAERRAQFQRVGDQLNAMGL